MKPTRRRIIDKATDLFSANRYDKVSIVSICRKAGIANSVFYYYFENKEQLFKEILSDLFDKLDGAFGEISGNSTEERLASMLSIHAGCHKRYRREIAVYREGEFIHQEFDHALKAIYYSSLEIVFQRQVSLAEYYYFIGGIRFISGRRGGEGISSIADELMAIITGGILNEDISLDQKAFTQEPEFLEAKYDSTRLKMIESGLDLIGRKGFDNTQIFEICANCGYSVGMLYKIFGNKQNFLAALMEHLNLILRNYLNGNKLSKGTRTDREIRRLYIYIDFFRKREHLFNLLREAEFTAPEYLRIFYDSIEEIYLEDLELPSDKSIKLTADFLMGIAHSLCGEILYSEEAPDITGLLTEIGHLLHSGIVLTPKRFSL